jgi:vacuolar-type H+-ATPase subunit E/Vma4
MGRRELLDALEREGQETMAAIADRETVEGERLRVAAEQRLDGLRLEQEQLCERQCRDLQHKIMSKALREAALIRLRAEHTLALRLWDRALAAVMQFRPENPEALLRALAAELPQDQWQTVRVNPGVASLAASCFPGAEIIADIALSAGFKATTADGGLTIDNTLQTRLERSWPELLPQLMSELRQLLE